MTFLLWIIMWFFIVKCILSSSTILVQDSLKGVQKRSERFHLQNVPIIHTHTLGTSIVSNTYLLPFSLAVKNCRVGRFLTFYPFPSICLIYVSKWMDHQHVWINFPLLFERVHRRLFSNRINIKINLLNWFCYIFHYIRSCTYIKRIVSTLFHASKWTQPSHWLMVNAAIN